MPSYVYKCPNEDCPYHTFYHEVFHSIAELDIEHLCTICESKKIKSVMKTVIQSFSVPANKPKPIIKIKA